MADSPLGGRCSGSGDDLLPKEALAVAKATPATGLELESDDELDELLDLVPDSGFLPGGGNARLGRYRILGALGKGQYARVYHGYDPVLERDVALKVIRPGLLRSNELRKRFLVEARALAQLRHPRIVHVFEVGRDINGYYIVMALIEGQSLAEFRDREPRACDPRWTAEIIADLAGALAHAHRRGIVHRDVKPANIQLDEAGNAYLMDFGIAYRTESGELSAPHGTRTGTPAYVAPELARGDQPLVLPASDQYSLGVVFFELLCGRTPFLGTPLHVLFQAMNEEPPTLQSIEPTVPASLAAICLKTLAKRPERRYASCDDLADHLNRWIRVGNDRPPSGFLSQPPPGESSQV